MSLHMRGVGLPANPVGPKVPGVRLGGLYGPTTVQSPPTQAPWPADYPQVPTEPGPPVPPLPVSVDPGVPVPPLPVEAPTHPPPPYTPPPPFVPVDQYGKPQLPAPVPPPYEAPQLAYDPAVLWRRKPWVLPVGVGVLTFALGLTIGLSRRRAG